MRRKDNPGTTPGSDQDKRRLLGRRRPYRSLRILAKFYDIAAPVVAIILIIVAVVSLIVSGNPLPARVVGFLLLLLFAGVYYLLLKAAAQVIYLLFDIANDVRRLVNASGAAGKRA